MFRKTYHQLLIFVFLIIELYFVGLIVSLGPIKEVCTCKGDSCVSTVRERYKTIYDITMGEDARPIRWKISRNADNLYVTESTENVSGINISLYHLMENIHGDGSAIFQTGYFVKQNANRDLNLIKSDKDIIITKYNIQKIIIIIDIIVILFVLLRLFGRYIKQVSDEFNDF